MSNILKKLYPYIIFTLPLFCYIYISRVYILRGIVKVPTLIITLLFTVVVLLGLFKHLEVEYLKHEVNNLKTKKRKRE